VSTNKTPIKILFSSASVLALLLFAACDFGSRLIFKQRTDTITYGEPYRSRIWWAARDYMAQNKTPDVVLFGASDMTCAVYRAEATMLNKPEHELSNHNSEFMKWQFASLNCPYTSAFCMGIPGEMPSDAYFIAKTLLTKQSKPKAIYLSVTPRSLYDATFGDPSSTDIFKLMSKLGGVEEYELSTRSSLWDKLDFLLSRASNVYAHKWDLVTLQHNFVHDVNKVAFNQHFDIVQTPITIRKASLLELPEDYTPEEVTDFPYDPKTAVFENNLPEYKARYKQFREKTLNQQLAFLKKLCELCKNEGILLVVGNSPVTNENRALIPKPVYDHYLSEASHVVRENGGMFENLDTAEFEHDDFFDSIHLNGKGGQKYLKQIAAVLSQSSTVASAGNTHAD
jgi:hypothetical protein